MAGSVLELDDIQSGVLRPRPTPYAATYVVFRVDDRNAGRELIRRLHSVVASAAHPTSPAGNTWVSVALSFQGLKALGVPQASLNSFAPQFQEGMAARAKNLGDTGESSPENWENLSAHLMSMSCSLPYRRIRSIWNPQWSARGKPIASYRASRRSGDKTATFVLVREKPSDSGTASAILQSKVVVFPAPILTSGLLKRVNSFWAIPTKWEKRLRYPNQRSLAATEAMLSFANCINVWPRSA